MPELYLDCAYGLGGDMFLALLVDLGLDLAPLAAIFGAGKLGGVVCGLATELASRDGLSGRRLIIEPTIDLSLCHLPQIEALISTLNVSEWVKARSIAAFRRLAEVEARVHGIAVNHIHFHEVSAVDTVVGIVGVFWGIERLGITRVTASILPWFRGEIIDSNGRLPLPAPATTILLQGKPVQPTDFIHEAITPTGALLLDALVAVWASGPAGTVASVGLAYGNLEVGGGLRGFLYEPFEAAAIGEVKTQGHLIEEVIVLESNIDHLTGEELGYCYDALLEAGALDVLYTHGVMKKNRPAGTLQAICRQCDLPAVEAAFFANTLTLGIRRQRVERVVLEQQATQLATPLGEVAAKGVLLSGEAYYTLEYDALVQLAVVTGRSVAQLRRTLGLAGVPPV